MTEKKNFLKTLQIRKISDKRSLLYEEELTENELYDSLKDMHNYKIPGNDGLINEFYLSFRDHIKDIYISSSWIAGIKKEFHV